MLFFALNIFWLSWSGLKTEELCFYMYHKKSNIIVHLWFFLNKHHKVRIYLFRSKNRTLYFTVSQQKASTPQIVQRSDLASPSELLMESVSFVTNRTHKILLFHNTTDCQEHIFPPNTWMADHSCTLTDWASSSAGRRWPCPSQLPQWTCSPSLAVSTVPSGGHPSTCSHRSHQSVTNISIGFMQVPAHIEAIGQSQT